MNPPSSTGTGPSRRPWPGTLVADGAESFHRVLTDPRDGAPLEIGRDSYRIPKATAPMAPAPGRQMPVPRLLQPVPGQRSRPPARLGPRRNHRDLQPRPALPQTPPAQTHHTLETHRRPPKTNHPAGSHPPAATTPANTPTGNHPPGRSNWKTPGFDAALLDATLLIDPGFSGRIPGYPLPSDTCSLPARTPYRDNNLPADPFDGYAIQENSLSEDTSPKILSRN